MESGHPAGSWGGRIFPESPDSIIGRLALDQATVFGRIARAKLNPLYERLYFSPPWFEILHGGVLRWVNYNPYIRKARNADSEPKYINTGRICF